MSDRRKIILYKKLLTEHSADFNCEDIRIVQSLQKEKMIHAKGKKIFINSDCDLPYPKQREANEKRYKTFVKGYLMDEEGVRTLRHKLVLPFHEEIYRCRELFFKKYPHFIENNMSFIEIIYGDVVLKEYATVYYQTIH